MIVSTFIEQEKTHTLLQVWMTSIETTIQYEIFIEILIRILEWTKNIIKSLQFDLRSLLLIVRARSFVKESSFPRAGYQ